MTYVRHVSSAPPELIVLRDGGLVLRAFEPSDLTDLQLAFADPDILQWNAGPPDEPGITEWMQSRNDWSAGDHASWAVAEPAGRLLGSVSLHHVDHDQLDGEVGYWIAPWARGRGVASRAVRLATAFAFAGLGLRRAYLYHAVENVASCAVARRSGFGLEGTLRQSHRYADGRYHDEHVHGRLSTDPVDPSGRSGQTGDVGSE
jgi:RimJ/RimL family protein N-acetyltransferase